METVRQYAAQQLRESGEEEAVRDRHADFFLALAEEAELVGPDQEAWLDRLNLERHHFWDALGWLEGKGDAGRGLRLVVALGGYLRLGNHYGEGRSRHLPGLPGGRRHRPGRVRPRRERLARGVESVRVNQFY